jgi:DNA polymerase lambda
MDTQPTSWLAYAIDDTDSQVLDFGDFGEDTQPSNATIDAKRPSSTSDLSTLVTFSQLPTAIAAVLMDDAPSLALPDVPASQPTIPRSLEKLSHRRAAARAHVQGIVDSEEGSTPSTPSPAVPATLADASQSLRRHNIIDYLDLNDADELMVGPADDGLGDMLKARAARKSSGNLVTGDSSDDDIDSQDRKDGEEEFFHEHARQKHNRFFEGTYQDYLPNISELEKTRRLRRREFFVCQKGPEAPSTNLNKHITDVLETLEQTCKNSGERWREYAYRKAVQILKSRPERIESADQARKLRGIGSRIADKIGEILETGTLRKAELQRSDEMTQTFALFGNVFGAGPTTIQKWYAMGYRTLEDLAAKANLNHQQQVGVQYYHEFLERMPREEVSRISARITAVIQQLDKDFIVEVCGSYRRLKTDCGDMDILVTHPRHIKLHGFLATAIPALRDAGLITDELTSSSKSPSQDKFMGVCWGGSGLHRRIDIQCVPLEEWPFALLYFTGSGHFNRSMRLWARRHGFSLSEHSLVRRFANDLKGDPILGIKTEKDIFDALGLEYKAPHERDV